MKILSEGKLISGTPPLYVHVTLIKKTVDRENAWGKIE
jgi:hypothetical protein